MFLSYSNRLELCAGYSTYLETFTKEKLEFFSALGFIETVLDDYQKGTVWIKKLRSAAPQQLCRYYA